MCGIFLSVRWQGQSHPNTDVDKGFSWNCESLRGVNGTRGPDVQKSYYACIRPGSLNASPPLMSAGAVGNASHGAGIVMEFFASELQLRGDAPVSQPHTEGGDLLCWNGEIFDGLDVLPGQNDGARLFQVLHVLDEDRAIVDLLGSVEGPYAFVYYHGASQKVFFGRDPLGRRSLLIHKPSTQHPYLLIASTTAGGEIGKSFEEVTTDVLHCLDVQSFISPDTRESSICALPRTRDGSVPRPFALLRRLDTTLPPEDLEAPTSLAHIPAHLSNAVRDLTEQLDRSVRQQVQDIPKWSTNEKGGARVAVLFSGGIDSTIIAYLASKHIPLDESIDLLNVAFENPRKLKSGAVGNGSAGEDGDLAIDSSYQVPDRFSGLEQLEELIALCPKRTWNFVEVNVPYEESVAAKSTVAALMLPSRTVMDMSLAIALYFASRGVGQLRQFPGAEASPYHSQARVILNGLGADELLGGYSRHRTAYNRGGWPEVIQELDIDRIPSRNLGRDDRIISSHGKEARHPFLSLSLVSYIASLPAHMKLDPRLELGMGDKLLLRLATYNLGLVSASCRKKRAMQFGSHSARMEGEKRGDLLLTE